MSTEADAIEALAGGPARSIQIADKELTITPIKTRELPALLHVVEPLSDMFGQTHDGAIQAALLRHPGAVIDAVAIAARVDRRWVDDLDLDQLVELTTVVIEVNADFFTRTLAPLIEQAGDRLTTALTGSTPPPD